MIILVFSMAAPVLATDHTLNPGDSIQENITNAVPGDTLILNPGIYKEHDITIDKNINIRANFSAGGKAANTIIDAKNAGRIFQSSGGYSLSIVNLTLRNAYSSGDGGAINSPTGGVITITSSRFFNCSAYRGGAIWSSWSLAITSTTFSDCRASGEGGAIHSQLGAGIFITSSRFFNCSWILSITSSTFSQCKATNGWGGAIESGGVFSTISSTKFSNCSADWGGAIDSFRSEVTISSSKFTNCSAYVAGGAIHATERMFTINTSTFSHCSARAEGGAIDAESDTGTIISSTFSNCSAEEENGGAMGITAATLTIISSAFSNCTAERYGGAIYYNSGTLTISSSTFSNCVADWGGAIMAYSGDKFTITSTKFSNCSAYWGGAINIDNISILTIEQVLVARSTQDIV